MPHGFDPIAVGIPRRLPLSAGFLQPLQRLENLGLARHRRLALFLFFLDDLFRRVGDELLVRKLGVDALDVGVGLGDLLVEPRASRPKNRSRPLAARPRPRRAPIAAPRPAAHRSAKEMLRQPGHPLDHIVPALRALAVSPPTHPTAPAASSVAGGIFISARTERIAVTRSTTQPISASAARIAEIVGSSATMTGGSNRIVRAWVDIRASCSAGVCARPCATMPPARADRRAWPSPPIAPR